MRNAAMAVLMMLGLSTTLSADEIFCEAGVVERSWELLKSAHFGFGRQEAAAFVVRGDDGSLEFVRWAATGEATATHFTGVVPPHTVAIVHTHPMDRMMPSSDDHESARRLGVPVYVLMRTGVTRTAGQANATLLLGDWDPAQGPHVRSCRANAVKIAHAAHAR